MLHRSLVFLSLIGVTLAIPAQRLNNYDNDFLQSEDNMTTTEILINRGYPAETHWVTTEDGYILEMHRIPYGKHSPPSPNKSVVFMLHGLLASSHDWILTPIGLGYALADAGYDVWLGNARGNTYSRRHVSLDPDNGPNFWKFSFDEIGQYDVPAQLQYILKLTKQDALSYVGHSQGTMAFWIAMETNPDLNEKIDIMFGLGPVAHMNHMITPIRYLAPLAKEAKIALDLTGIYEIFPSSTVKDHNSSMYSSFFSTKDNDHFEVGNQTSCGSRWKWEFGVLYPYDNEELLCNHSPSGTSVTNVLHFAQSVNSGEFARFDYGRVGNLKHYHQKTPPSYDLSKVKAPVILMWGQRDWMADPEDVAWLAAQLPNLQDSIQVGGEDFNHVDFIWGNHADRDCYSIIIDKLNKVIQSKTYHK